MALTKRQIKFVRKWQAVASIHRHCGLAMEADRSGLICLKCGHRVEVKRNENWFNLDNLSNYKQWRISEERKKHPTPTKQ